MRRALLLVAALVLLAAGCSSGTQKGLSDVGHTGPYMGAGLTPPQPRPAFTLTSSSGPVDFATATKGHPTLLFFGYTHCPDECPATMADTALALSKVPDSVRKQTDVVFVTTDPARDTPQVIDQWLATFNKGSDAHWIGLSGSQAEIDAAQAAAHITLAEDNGETHSTQLLLYGPDDYARVSFLRTDDEAGQIVHDLPLIAGTAS